MNKTTEEADRKRIHGLSLAFTKELHDDATVPYHTCRDALTWLFARPLRDRLTDEERENVKRIYAEASQWLKETEKFENWNDALRVAAVALHDRMESIFGAEMFNENKDKK